MLVGNGLFAAFQWLYLIVIVRWNGAADAGLYALSQAIIYPVFILLNMQLRRLQVIDRSNLIGFGNYFAFALLSGVAATIASFALYSFSSGKGIEATYLFSILCLAKLVDSLSEACYGQLQHHENMRPIAISLIFRNLLAFVVFATLLRLHSPLWLATLAIPACWIAVLIFYDLRKVGYALPGISSLYQLRQTLVQIAKNGLPLGMLIFLNQVFLSAPRLSLEHYSGIRALGEFAPLASLMTLGSIVVGAATSAALPRLARFHSDSLHKDFSVLTIKLLSLATTIGLVAVAASISFDSYIINLLFAGQFSGNPKLLTYLMIASLFWYMAAAAGTALTAQSRLVQQTVVSAVALVLTLLVCVTSIPEYGQTAAAAALIVGAGTKFVMQLVLVMTKNI